MPGPPEVVEERIDQLSHVAAFPPPSGFAARAQARDPADPPRRVRARRAPAGDLAGQHRRAQERKHVMTTPTLQPQPGQMPTGLGSVRGRVALVTGGAG